MKAQKKQSGRNKAWVYANMRLGFMPGTHARFMDVFVEDGNACKGAKLST